jgi:Mor family transcriptional regulator
VRKTRFCRKQVAEMLKLAKRGVRIKDICAKFGGVHHSFVQGVLRRHAVSGPPRKLLVGKRLEAAIAMYQNGTSSTKVAKKLRVSARTVLAALEEARVQTRARRKFDDDIEKTICAQYPCKRSTQLAKEYQCSEQLILDALTRQKIPIRSKRKLYVDLVRELPEQYERIGSCKRLAAIYGVAVARSWW